MKIQDYTFPSATGVCEIHGSVYLPDNDDVKLVMAIHHGMAEHKERYNDFIEFLTSNGIAVSMYDMANHGKSNQDKSLTGYFGKKDGYINLVKDFKTAFDALKSDFPDKKIVIMGHSMGSFVVRCFTAWYKDAGFDGAIYMGTGGPNSLASVGEKVSALISKLTGGKRKSKLLDKMTFGSYGKEFEKRTDFDWLSRDQESVDKYIADDECGFIFSAQGMNDLVKLNICANSEEWYDNIPDNLPILLISGDMDPVGNYGDGVREICGYLFAAGKRNVTVDLYPKARHEVLNETNKLDVYKDIINFINSKVLAEE